MWNFNWWIQWKQHWNSTKNYWKIISYPLLYDAYFKVLLSNDDESILLTGTSDF